MAKPHLTVHFHCEETHGAVLDGALRFAASRGITGQQPFELPGARPPGRSLPAVLRTAHSLGVPVLLSLSNERLLRALAEPAERKALSDGVSRGRLLPTPVAAFGAELPILAPFEVADEIRLNIDLWKRALFTPPFAARPECDRKTLIRDADPARICAAPQLVRGGKSLLLTIDLTPLELQDDPEQRLYRVGELLRARPEFRLASPGASPHGWADQALREILGGQLRFPTFSGDSMDGFDVRSHGFPLDLARLLTDGAPIDKVFAASADALVEAEFDVARLEPRLRHGLLLRRLTRSGSTTEIPRSERARASYLLAVALTESLTESLAASSVESSAGGSAIQPAAYDLAKRIPSRLRLDLEPATDEQALSRIAEQLPAPGSKPATRAEFLGQLRRVLVAVLAELDGRTRSGPAPTSSQGCHATA